MEQAADKVQAESLDAQVDALLGEMNQACEKLQTQLGDDAPQAAAPVSAGETKDTAEALDDLNEQVDELLKGVMSVTPRVDEPAGKKTEVLARQTSMPDEGQAATEAGVPGAGAQTEQVFNDELAALTESLLAEPVVETPKAAEAPKAVAAVTTAVAPAPAATKTAAPGAAPQARVPQEAASAAGAAAPATVTAVEAPAAGRKAGVGSMAARVGRAVGSALLRVARLGEPHALRVATMISAPILSKPKQVRDTLGWLAAWSLFVGTCFAVFVFFIRTPPSPMTTDPHVRLADEHASAGQTGEVVRRGMPHVEEPAAHGAGEGHGEAAGGEGHGEAKPKTPKKPDAKKAPPKKKDTKKKPEAHGEEGAAAEHH